MKNISKKILASILCLGMVIVFSIPISASNEVTLMIDDESYYHTDSEAYSSAPDAVQEIMDMQNEITLSLSKENYRYVYDYDLIKDIVYAFDFSEFNELTGQNLTPETYLEIAIEGIESVEFPMMETYAYTTGPMCGYTMTQTIWNSRREFRSKSATTSHAYKLRLDADSLNAAWAMTKAENTVLLMGLYVAYPGLKWAVMAGGVVKSIPVNWMKGVANSISKNNYNGCGTVLDVNKVGWYSSWNQLNN